MESKQSVKVTSEILLEKGKPYYDCINASAIESIAEKINSKIEVLFSSMCEKIFSQNWKKVKNKNFYYLNSHNCFVVDSSRVKCSCSEWVNEVDGVPVAAPSDHMIWKMWFHDYRDMNPLAVKDSWAVVNKDESTNYGCETALSYIVNGSYYGYYCCDTDDYYSGDIPSLHLPVSRIGWLTKIEFVLKYNLIFEDLTDEEEAVFTELKKLYDDGGLEFIPEKSPVVNQKIIKLVNECCGDENKEITVFGIKINHEIIVQVMKDTELKFTDELYDEFTASLLGSDTKRVEINPYDEKKISDPNRGHWELWFDEKDAESGIVLKTDRNFAARDPRADIKEDGVVGIDFGTKSTVVVFQNGSDHTMPMRIGSGNFKEETNASDYENPTFMEFCDIRSFLDEYNACSGRPLTSYDDIKVSHNAKNNLENSTEKSGDYRAFFKDLKHWCISRDQRRIIRDKKRHREELPPFCELSGDNFNPVEIYAYYLGLFINNMYNGIFMDYILSFPVTYEKKVRSKILQSFENGIKKSLPPAVLNDEEAMKHFRIIQGAAEPAAYAVCALQQYGFEDADKNIYYGIFDFGGGTADFDFGVWRKASGSETRRYSNVISHFGAGGDKYLGGENLLAFMAYEVFKENADVLRKCGVQFIKPDECELFTGSQLLISDSEEAGLNMIHMKEYLRPLWEGGTHVSGTTLSMWNNKAESVNVRFEIDSDLLEKLMKVRIEKGVRNFFQAMLAAFSKDNAADAEDIQIFLAGNSSRSEIVWELFNKYSEAYYPVIAKKLGIDVPEEPEESDFFKIYPPLGTEEAWGIQEAKGIYVDREALDSPTGKTGVAYGLIECRSGSSIKVISEIRDVDEIKFSYYLGYNENRKFKIISDRNIKYGKWIDFIDAFESDFEIYYTDLPEAVGNSLPVSQVRKKRCRIAETHNEARVYIRAVSPSEIEYAVALPDEIDKEQYITDVEKITLN